MPSFVASVLIWYKLRYGVIKASRTTEITGPLLKLVICDPILYDALAPL